MAFIGPYQQFVIDGIATVVRVDDWVKQAVAINTGLATVQDAALAEAKGYADTENALDVDASVLLRRRTRHRTGASARSKRRTSPKTTGLMCSTPGPMTIGTGWKWSRRSTPRKTTRLDYIDKVIPKVSNIALDADGVPYFSPVSTVVHIIPDGDGEPYFITFMSASAAADGTPYCRRHTWHSHLHAESSQKLPCLQASPLRIQRSPTSKA